MRTRTTRLATALTLVALAAPAAAMAGWREPTGPVNHRPDRTAFYPSLAAVAGVPHVAWAEWDENDSLLEIRVGRLGSSGSAWEQPAGTVNHGSEEHGQEPSLADVGGTPYVAWKEGSGHGNDQIRVSRPTAAGSAWEEVGSGSSPVNHGPNAWDPSLAAVGGVPYVARTESGDGPGAPAVIRVSRMSSAGNGWVEVGGPVSDPASLAVQPSIAAVGGVPHVAWTQWDGTNSEVRVARLNRASGAWEEVVGGPSPINHDSAKHATDPSLTAVGGVPHVAWIEAGDANRPLLRVARLNAAGSAWEEIGGGPNPFGQPDGRYAQNPSLAAVGGRPYVAWVDAPLSGAGGAELRVARPHADGSGWAEVVGGQHPISRTSDPHDASLAPVGGVPYVAWFDGADGTDGDGYETRVSRLEPEVLEQAEVGLAHSAFLFSRVRTHGVAHPVAFEYGEGGALDRRTATQATAYGQDEDVVVRLIDGLAPRTEHSWRTIGFDGFVPTAAGPARTFTTLAPPVPVVRPDPVLIGFIRSRTDAVAGRRVSLAYALSRDADVTLEVRRCGGGLKATVTRDAVAAGRNKIAWDGRIRRRRAAAGCYSLTLRALTADGQTASDRATLRLTRRTVRRR